MTTARRAVHCVCRPSRTATKRLHYPWSIIADAADRPVNRPDFQKVVRKRSKERQQLITACFFFHRAMLASRGAHCCHGVVGRRDASAMHPITDID